MYVLLKLFFEKLGHIDFLFKNKIQKHKENDFWWERVCHNPAAFDMLLKYGVILNHYVRYEAKGFYLYIVPRPNVLYFYFTNHQDYCSKSKTRPLTIL